MRCWAVPEPLFLEAVAKPAVVDAQELGHPGSHVHVVLLAFGALLVKELVDGIILGLKLEQDGHDDKERLAEIRRTALAAGLAVGNLVAGIILDGIGTGKADKRLLVSKTAQIANLGYELRPHGFADAGHSHDGIVFRKLGSEAIHLGTVGFYRAGDGVELGDSLLHQQLAGVGLGHQRELLPGIRVDLDGLLLGKVVAVALAPLPVAFNKGALADFGDAVHMLEGVHEVHPFLAAVRAHRAVEVPVRAGIALLQQGNQVVVQRGPGLAGQLELAMQGLEVVTNRIHGSILQQNLPFVNGKLGDLQGIRPVGLDLADADILPVILDGQRVHCGHEETGAVHAHGKRFVVPTCVLHDDPSLAVQTVQLLRQRSEAVRGMQNLEGLHDNLPFGSEHRDRALAVGNIDTNCKHVESSRCVTTMALRLYPSPILSVR